MHLRHDREVQERCRNAAVSKTNLNGFGNINFPSPESVDKQSVRIEIPDTFRTPVEYRTSYIAALEEEIK